LSALSFMLPRMPLAPLRAVDAVRERDFRLLYVGQTLSNLGSALVPIALAFAVLDLTGSATYLGLVLLAARLPWQCWWCSAGVAPGPWTCPPDRGQLHCPEL
jgi:hypothetical protein